MPMHDKSSKERQHRLRPLTAKPLKLPMSVLALPRLLLFRLPKISLFFHVNDYEGAKKGAADRRP